MGTADLVSFDVFDTLLSRRCTGPEGVYERAFALAGAPVRREMAEAFVQHRQMAEAEARRVTQEPGIETIYDHFPVAAFGLNAEDRPRLAAAELAAEHELCVADGSVLETAMQARAAGARIGFVSDTCWNGGRLAALLRHAAPGLEWDFLYSSCDHGLGKRDGLLSLMLAEQGGSPDRTVHLGDNPIADVQAARQAGLQAVHLPQCTPALAAIFQRENALFPLFCGWTGASARLDGGARTARRAIARAASGDVAHDYGLTVLGPVLAAFDRFAAKRVERLRAMGRKVAVAFLGRDGLAPLEVWRASRDASAAYVEINRRLAVMISARDTAPVAAFFAKIPRVDHSIATGFLGMDTPRLAAFFQDGAVSGTAFATALPNLLDSGELATVSRRLGDGVLAHLRAVINGFDDMDDLVLVDLGYGGTVQKGLRALFAARGLPHRLHGLYLITQDELLCGLPEHDSARGLISDAVLLPLTKRALLSNAAVLEQMCAAATGSVRDHADDGAARYESDARSEDQHRRCTSIRQGAAAHAAALGTAPVASPAWAAVILARALLLPTDEERALLGGMQRDVNLGSQVLVPLAAPDAAAALMDAKALPSAFAPQEIPAWMAAGVAERSPLHAYLYAAAAACGLPADVVGEVPDGKAEAVLIGGDARPLTVTRLRTSGGDLRLRLPLRREDHIATVAVSATALPRRGYVRSVTLQAGDTAAQALASSQIDRLNTIEGLNLHVDRRLYQVTTEDAHLLLHVPPPAGAIGILTLTVTALE